MGIAHDGESRMKERSVIAMEERVKRLSIAALARSNQTIFVDLRARRKLGGHRYPRSLRKRWVSCKSVLFASPAASRPRVTQQRYFVTSELIRCALFQGGDMLP